MIWEERAQTLTSYSNFWKQFYRKFPQYRAATVTTRKFAPGESKWIMSATPLEWIDLATGEIHAAYVFVSGLGFSQLLFAWAAEDMKSRNWLGLSPPHVRLYGGAPHVTVPDCLKQGGGLKHHLSVADRALR